MSYSQDHQSDSVWQKYPATILQVIKGMMGEGCMHLLGPFFLISGKLSQTWAGDSSFLCYQQVAARRGLGWASRTALASLLPFPLQLHSCTPIFPLLGECAVHLPMQRLNELLAHSFQKTLAKSPRKVWFPLNGCKERPITACGNALFEEVRFTLQIFCIKLSTKCWWNVPIQIFFSKVFKEILS